MNYLLTISKCCETYQDEAKGEKNMKKIGQAKTRNKTTNIEIREKRNFFWTWCSPVRTMYVAAKCFFGLVWSLQHFYFFNSNTQSARQNGLPNLNWWLFCFLQKNNTIKSKNGYSQMQYVAGFSMKCHEETYNGTIGQGLWMKTGCFHIHIKNKDPPLY